MMEIEKKDDGVLELNGEATVFHAEDLHAGLLEHVESIDGNLTIDLSNVTSVDAAGAQILISLRKTNGHQEVSFVGLSDELNEQLKRSGLHHCIT